MRTAWIKSLERLAQDNPDIMLLVGDIGFGVVQDFAERFPNQFLNTGINEQAMTGMAAGIALTGKTVFTYSIANFPTLRCLEQIRNDVCYHRTNVVIVSVGGGYCYGALGASHHATEDLAIMRALPGLTVLAPGDPLEVDALMEQIVARRGPCYLRLGRAGEPVVHQSPPQLTLGEILKVREGDAATLLSIGGMLKVCSEVVDDLAEEGVRCSLLSVHTLKPLDREAIIRAAQATGVLITVEEHSLIGGLGSAVAEVLMDAGLSRTVLKRLGIKDGFSSQIGDQNYHLEKQGLTRPAIKAAVLSAVSTVSLQK